MLRHLAIATATALSAAAAHAATDWPSYNRTPSSERYVVLDAIDAKNVGGLKTLCEYDTGQQVSFQSGLIQVDGALLGTTEQDTFSIDPDTCKENWRAHEVFESGALKVNRGLAWADGRVFRGSADGRVLAYEARTGKRLWATTIADAARGESVPAAPIAWDGLVFVGNAGGDNKGVKGRIYALDAKDGRIVWEFYLVPKEAGDFARGPSAPAAADDVAATWKNEAGFPISGGANWTSYSLDAINGLLYVPAGNPAPDFVGAARGGANLYSGSVVVLDAKTGAYQRHFQLVPRDVHDWDVSAPPALITSKAGRKLMAVTPKDGHLYAIDLGSGKTLYRKPMTRVFNTDSPFTPQGTRFCPGTQGGAEWNGPAYDPEHNLLFTGQVDWCATVRVEADAPQTLANAPSGKPWSGSPDGFGQMDDAQKWAGWMTASDADSGKRRWQFKAPFPLLGGTTPTSGGLLFFGDMGGNLYALDAASGKKLWSQDLGGAVGGGVISYDTGRGQRIAVAAGMTSPIWPTPKVNAKIVVLGLDAAPAESASQP
ncbi:pyrroloquinoline quinone-dependent dehydrogenase [Dokdonella ginsengisoli]|uniref:Pyrroloquinoline quinone-dependent dehydrogenase n=1 Tax=Dokdonella ginsengisoli TaxID=363846 RepID=A0ABV9QRT6_9GAMM